MIKEAIETLLDLKRPETVEPFTDGRVYMLKDYVPVHDPTPTNIEINTLTGIIDYIKTGIDIDVKNPDSNLYFIHIHDYKKVSIKSELFGAFKQREILVTSEAQVVDLRSSWMDSEEFIITLNSKFVHAFDHGYLVNLASGLTQAASKELKDNGVTQSTVVKNGISLVQEQIIKNPVTLQPYKTFPEIVQPDIEYLFRLRGQNGPPECALFEADGGRWKLETMHKIKEWIEGRLQEEGIVMSVIA